jgi:Holliday junction resolvase
MSLKDIPKSRVERALTNVLTQAGIPPREIRRPASPGPDTADLVVELPGELPRLIIEIKPSSRSAQIRAGIEQVTAYAEALGGVPVLAVPHMGEAGARLAESAGVGFVDLSGNASIVAAGLVVHITGRPNRAPEQGRPSSPFAPASARVVRALLCRPDRWWHQFDLVDVTGLSAGQTSKVARRLADENLVEIREDRAIHAVDSYALLDAWEADYPRFASGTVLDGHVSGSGFELTRTSLQKIHDQDPNAALTGLSAAWAYDKFVTFRLASIYVDDVDSAAEWLGMRVEPRGANIRLIQPNDPGILNFADEPGGMRCVSRVQTYLDLGLLPERAAEARDHLRKELFGKR